MTTIAAIAFAVIVLTIIVVLLLRRQLREKYALLWLLIGFIILVLAVFPELLVGLARLLGVALPSNLIFALSIALLVGVTLHLSWELSQAEDEVRRVAEDVAILRADIESITARVDGLTADGRDSSMIGDGQPQSTARGEQSEIDDR